MWTSKAFRSTWATPVSATDPGRVINVIGAVDDRQCIDPMKI